MLRDAGNGIYRLKYLKSDMMIFAEQEKGKEQAFQIGVSAGVFASIYEYTFI